MLFAFLLAALPGLGEAAPATRVAFELTPRVQAVGPVQGSLSLRLLSGLREPIVIAVAPGQPAAADLPSGSTWEATVRVPGYWSPREVFTVGESGIGSVRRLALWPTGKASGSLRMENPAERLPREVEVKFQSPPTAPRKAEISEGSATCPVQEGGVWSCDLPAAVLDVSVRVPGFIPHYRWGLSIQPARPLSLGAVELKKGASIAGWVLTDEGVLSFDRCEVRLGPLLAPGSGPEVAERLRRTAVKVGASERGFFQLDGVAPGNYLLEVEHPGYARATVHPVEVWPGAETYLNQPVVLRKPLQLEFTVSPALDWLGRPWQVEVYRAADSTGSFSHASAFQGLTDSQGRIALPGQAPGTFSATVRDSLGNELFENANLSIQSPAEAQQQIDIQLITVQGTVFLGDEPLKASLLFEKLTAGGRVAMESDEEGRFQGVVPHEGLWRVSVRAGDLEVEARQRVRIEAGDRGLARVSIDIPDTRVFGKVVDEEGRAASGAKVAVDTPEGGHAVETDEEGEFEIRGLPEGELALGAEKSAAGDRWTSDWVFVAAVEGRPAGPVELRLRKVRTLTGRVQAPLGPVAGASILLLTHRPAVGFGDNTRSGLDGSFTFRVPARAENVVAVVSPPGHALKAFELPADGVPAVLNVPREAGSLEIWTPYSAEENLEMNLQPRFFQNGLPLPGGALVHWARAHGILSKTPGIATYPRLAPGRYTVCLAHRAVLPEAKEGSCVSGSLEAGGTLRLELPRLKSEKTP